VEATAKDLKKMNVADEALVESEAQREARHAEVKKALAELEADDPR
jgi:predicted transcriptional regulator